VKLLEIFNYLNSISPFSLQKEWDNSGLILGSWNDEISDITISLEVDEHVLANSVFGSLIVVHHPLIFSKIKKIESASYPDKFIVEAIKKNIKIVALHTNFDQTHLNRYVLEKVLKFKPIKLKAEKDFLVFNPEMRPADLISFLKKTLKLEQIKHTFTEEQLQSFDKIFKVALITGSGASYLEEVAKESNISVLLTGDVKYHEAMHGKAIGIDLIDIGHYESEIFFSKSIESFLKNLELNTKIIDSKNPFRYF
jgi:dinuclear metal center YbgI/SA1388 family protein